MSWKSFVSAGLLCILASPVFAAPTVSAIGGGTQSSAHLDANSNWVWQFRIATTNPVPTGSTPLAAELGFTTTGTSDDIVGNAANTNAVVWDTPNPGSQIPIFGWETLTDVDPGPGVNNRPVGVQTEPIGNDGKIDEVFSALGSALISTTAPQNYIAISVERPIVTNPAVMATTTVNVLGAYSGNGRVAELDAPGAAGACPFDSCNYDIYGGSVMRQAQGGDTNLDGDVAGADYSTVLANFNIND